MGFWSSHTVKDSGEKAWGRSGRMHGSRAEREAMRLGGNLRRGAERGKLPYDSGRGNRRQ